MHLVSFERLDSLPHRGSARRSRDSEPLRRLGDEVLGFEALEPTRPGAKRLGAVLQFGPRLGWVVDLNRTLAIKLACDDVGAPEAEADSLVPANMLAFLRLGSRAMAAAQIALDFAVQSLDRYDAPDILRAGAVEPVESLRLCAPIPRPGKIIGVESNYPDETNTALTEPTLFLKAHPIRWRVRRWIAATSPAKTPAAPNGRWANSRLHVEQPPGTLASSWTSAGHTSK